jgi:hypothetical protein
MTLRQTVARRVELVASLNDAATFIEKTGTDEDWADVVVSFTYPVRSKAEADKVIEYWRGAARPLWRNGVYMAELEPARLPTSANRRRMASGEPERCGGIFELHFVPPITEQAA